MLIKKKRRVCIVALGYFRATQSLISKNPYPCSRVGVIVDWGKGFKGYRGTRIWSRVNYFKAVNNK
jgi:hypothetical protein